MKQSSGRVARFLNVFLSLVILLLIYQNVQLKDQLPTSKKPDVVAVGEAVPGLVLQDLEGQQVDLTYPASSTRAHTLLYILSTQCKACKETLPKWNSLDDVLAGKGMQSYYVIVNEGDDVASYAQTYDLTGKAYTPVDGTAFSKDYKVFGVPMTLLIDDQGKVAFSHLGVLSLKQVKNLTTTLEADCADGSDCAI